MKIRRVIAFALVALACSAAMAWGAHAASSVTNAAPYSLNLHR